MLDKFEIGDLVRTPNGLGVVELIKKADNAYQYLIKLKGDGGSYFFTDKEVFPYV